MASLGSLLGRLLEKLEQRTRPRIPEVLLERLEEASRLPLPYGLEGPPPRKDVWGTAGYLIQPRYATLYRPLLTRGQVTRGIVFEYECSVDPDGCDTTARYAWFDASRSLCTEAVRESYDGMHAALGRDKGIDTKSLLVDMEAHLKLGRVLTIVHDESRHVVFESLRTDYVHDFAELRAQAKAAAAAGRRLGPTPANDMEQLFDRWVLDWTADDQGPQLHFGAEQVIPIVPFTPVSAVRPDASTPGAWWLFRTEPRPEHPWMRILPAKSAGASKAWRITGEAEQEVGHAELRGERLVVSQRGTTLLLSLAGAGGWKAENEQGQPRLSCERLPKTTKQRVPLQGQFRVSLEALLLALVAAGRPWSITE